VHYINPIITPKSPKALPKISIVKSRTKVSGAYESASAKPLPATPTTNLINIKIHKMNKITHKQDWRYLQ
jgi:hypothetical protein